jgi:hypothetical protein
VARLGHGQQGLVPLLVERGVTTTAAPLYFLDHNPQLSFVPADKQLGSVLDPVTTLRQKHYADRPQAFRDLTFGAEADIFVPDRARLSDEELLALATGPIDEERARGATLMLTAYHLAGGPGTRGRDVELLLARLGVEHFRRQGMAQPPPFAAVAIEREIWAVIAVGVRDLRSPRSRAALADAYLAIGADGLWVKIAGFHERAPKIDIQAGAAFLGLLDEASAPVLSCGAGQLHLALLADGISASIGIAETERFSIPTTWKPKPDGKRPGRRRMAYHGKLHRSFRVSSEQARKAFQHAACDCGVHPRRKPPTGLLVNRHTAILRTEQASTALDGDRDERREWLLGSSTRASWAAGDAEMPDEHTPSATYQAVFDGLDAGRRDAAAPGEQDEL